MNDEQKIQELEDELHRALETVDTVEQVLDFILAELERESLYIYGVQDYLRYIQNRAVGRIVTFQQLDMKTIDELLEFEVVPIKTQGA